MARRGRPWTGSFNRVRLRPRQARQAPIREAKMTRAMVKMLGAVLSAAAMLLPATASFAAELDPKAVIYSLPDQIKWSPVTPAGNQQAVLFGDPTKPGLYGVLTKWTAGNHFSKPHFHPNDRFITRSEEHTSELQSHSDLVCRLL